ncbi:DnaB-like helicase C-terminal domain-containing protein [Ruminococcus sp.]|uniref:DnaB-like helicase C-terminal domain-containing protein n=1 Tax=Ruminococcus sp. TaxID=41978 RepID=UPI001B773F62|nr:DnaB-like helicase C-terminal domain-containing protein [Ruminococcus sp.]MBP5433748.1 AAA family ATPase [Ruminococcus sp.]
MNISIELQVIARILTTTDPEERDILCSYDSSYYDAFKPQIEFILKHRDRYGKVPDKFTYQTTFPEPDINFVVNEKLEYFRQGLIENKQTIMLREAANKVIDEGAAHPAETWAYLLQQGEKALDLSNSKPLSLVHDAEKRSKQVEEYNKQKRIPTGFPEIDNAMYGGLSTVEELILFFARMNNGKSWVATRLMETAQAHGFPVLYYSPEMQGCFLGTRFDTWRAHFSNSQLHQGKYAEDYIEYLKDLEKQDTDAIIIEDKDAPDNVVNVPYIKQLVRKNGIKLVIIDGLSYMEDSRAKYNDTDSTKYKNLCADLFSMSKQCGCAVAVFMQANRASKESKDENGETFPNIYNIEGSDHPARIATQAFAMRQLFEKHILELRMEKARSAANQKTVFSYSWDINTGDVQYMSDPGEVQVNTPVISTNTETPDMPASVSDIGLDIDDTVEF